DVVHVRLRGDVVRVALALAPVLAVGACGSTPKPAAQEPTVTSKVTTRHVVAEEPEVDSVSVTGERGRMDVDAISKSLAPHTAALTDCYMSRVGKRRWLGGNVEISWDISRDGDITAVKLASSELGAWPIEKCLLDIAREATFPKPVGGDADFQVPLNFSAKGAALAWDEVAGLKAVGGQVASLEACDKALVKRGADEAKAARKAPHKKGEKKPLALPPPPQDVTITMYVGPKGAAQSVGFSSKASVVDGEWGDCAEKAAMAWRLPDPRGHIAKLAVKYKPAAATAAAGAEE
ncbi:MAG: AgmX/PglI C-terminal domain-containing protein, partial [Proteobacteria bacterium]|nr:AgmX/PglI C-terminal domain-containing protein [Pseudomonadota bacterium]